MQLTRPRALILVALALFGSVSCTAVSRGLGKVTANKYASARSGVHWPIEPPQLEPLAPEDKQVYLSFRDLSGSGLDLQPLIAEAARAQGWTVTTNPQEAKVRLRGQVKFFDEVNPETGGLDVANKMGWIAGAATGIGTGVLVADATDNYLAGAAAGAAVGGLAGIGVSNASKPREYALIVDFVLEEFSAEPIAFEQFSESGSAKSSGSGAGSPRTSDSGVTTASSGSSTTRTVTSNYYPHAVRLAAWANQMNMKRHEAELLIIGETEKVVQFLLPQ